MDVQWERLWRDLETDLTSAYRHFRSRLDDLDVSTKSDRTLLTEADLAVEALIVNRIREFDPGAVIIAEEDGRTAPRSDVLNTDSVIWVIDPIDGTAQFVEAGEREFCSVVCVLSAGEPVASFVLAPELGRDRGPITIVGSQAAGIKVNGVDAGWRRTASGAKWASVTRSVGATWLAPH